MAEIDYLIDDLKLYNKWIYEDAYDYNVLDNTNLIVTLNDGRRYFYDYSVHSGRFLPDEHDYTYDEYKKEFSYRLFYLMKRRHITQKELSEMTGISEYSISAYITEKSIPSSFNLDRISKALEVNVGYWNI